MKVCVFGCGNVGLIVSASLSEIGHEVYCIDTNDYKIKNINQGILDIYEPNLAEIIQKNKETNRLRFYTKYEPEQDTDVYIIAVNTQEKSNDEVDISNITNVLNKIISSITKYSVIIIKSTVPIGSCDNLTQEFKQKTTIGFDIVANPEFLSQGSALDNFLNPERIIVGTKSQTALERIKELYAPLKSEIIVMDEKSAELTKYASSSFLAAKISFINEIANLASMVHADINLGAGYGGSCFSEDVARIINIADKYKVDLNVVKSARIANENQKRRFIGNILKHYNYNIENKVFCIWGLSYKPNTNDIKNAPSNTIIDTLIRYGATIRAYDPKAQNSAIKQYKSKEDALMSSNALIIATEWDEFLNPDFEFIAKNLADRVIFDARNIYTELNLAQYGLEYYYTGRPE